MKYLILLGLLTTNLYANDLTKLTADGARAKSSEVFKKMWDNQYKECLSSTYASIHYTIENEQQNFTVVNMNNNCWGVMPEKVKIHLEKNGYKVEVKTVGSNRLRYYTLFFIDWIK